MLWSGVVVNTGYFKIFSLKNIIVGTQKEEYKYTRYVHKKSYNASIYTRIIRITNEKSLELTVSKHVFILA